MERRCYWWGVGREDQSCAQAIGTETMTFWSMAQTVSQSEHNNASENHSMRPTDSNKTVAFLHWQPE